MQKPSFRALKEIVFAYLKIVGGAFLQLWTISKKAFRHAVGEVSWRRPAWIAQVAERRRVFTQKSEAWVRANPKRAKYYTVGYLVFIVAAFCFWNWYRHLPQPHYVEVKIQVPPPQPLVDNSKPFPLDVSFSESAAPLTSVGKVVSEGIEMLPAQKGYWKWQTDRLLSFTPEQDWPIKQDFKISFTKSFLAPHVLLKDYTERFTTRPFNVTLARSEFYINSKNPNEKRGTFYLNFTHPIDLQSLRDRTEITLEDKNAGIMGGAKKSLKFDVTQDAHGGQGTVISEEVGIPDQDSIMTIKVSKGVKSTRGGAGSDDSMSTTLPVPGMYNYFRIGQVRPTLVRNEKFEPEQVLIIQTTASAKSENILKGLEVYVLPKDKPAEDGERLRKNYRWSSASEITPKIESLLKKVPLEMIPTENEASELHSFKFKVDVGRHLLVKIKKGIKSFGDYVLSEDYNGVVRVPPFPRELAIMHAGAILSLSGEKKLSVLSRNIDSVHFEIGRVIPNEIPQLISQKGGDFKDARFNNYTFNADNVSERFEEVQSISVGDKAATNYSVIDLSKYLSKEAGNKRGLFFLKTESWDPKEKRPTGLQDQRIILVTDLGILAKQNANGSWAVFIQSLAGGQAVAGATVEIMGKNGIAVLSHTTDATGEADFPSLSDFVREKAPTAFIVKKDGDLSYLPFKDNYDRMLNYSRFDISGVHVAASDDRLTAFVFSDRGIYRPGDTLNAAYIVKSSAWNHSVNGVPVEVTLQDPKGVEVFKEKRSLDALGFDELSYQSTDNAPTGTYRASIYLIKDKNRDVLLGSTTLRIEEFLPDRMKITSHLSEEKTEGWVSPKGLKGRVTLKNLFGTPAQNRKITASIRLTPAFPSFKKYSAYRFSDPKRTEKNIEESLQDQRTDNDGMTEFDLNLERFDKATYRLYFSTEGFESEGGRGVHSDSSALVSPLEFLVGYKSDGDLGYISRDAARNIELIAIDSNLKQIQSTSLKLQLVEIKWVSVLAKQDNGLYKYQSVLKENVLSEKALTIGAKGQALKLPTDKPGDYAYVVRDADNTELNKIPFGIVGKANLARGLDRNAELQVTLNRSDYNPGSEIQVSIKAPYTGAGLITIERDNVFAHKWFKTDTTSTVQSIQLPPGLEGNAYINVSFVRGLQSSEIFMSPLSYGVAPFSISRAGRTNEITLNAPEKVKPGEKFKIRYHTTKPGRAVIYAVDEGILQVANYKTPDPLSYFLSKKALQVSTLQILDLLLPEFSLVQSLRSGAGGDEGMSANGQNLNPFKRKNEKPVVYWSGIVDTGPQDKVAQFDVPDYFNGSVRVMGLVVSSDSLGSSEKRSLVRGDFVLSPNLPTFVAPGDEFEMSLGVSNNAEKSGTAEIAVQVTTPSSLEIVGDKNQKIKIKEGFEDVVKFKVRAKEPLGAAAVKFVAQAGKWSAHYNSELSVRPSSPYITELQNAIVHDSNASWDLKRNMYNEFRQVEVSASPLPLGLAHGLVAYLDEYPYGCTEQLVSKAFPILALYAHPEFGVDRAAAQERLTKLLHVLRSRQDPYGAFGYWNGESSGNEHFHTLYALHFLTEAKDAGFAIPKDLLDRGIEYLKGQDVAKANSMSEARMWAYALYILARNGKIMNNELSLLRKTLEVQFKNQWESDFAGIYIAATYHLYKKEDEARKLFYKSRVGAPMKNNEQWWERDDMRDALLVYLAAKHFPEFLKTLAPTDLENLFKPTLTGHYNTLSSSYAILAAGAYSDYVQKVAAKEWKVSAKEVDAKGQEHELAFGPGLFPKVNLSPSAKKLKMSSDGSLPLFVQIKEGGFDRDSPTAAANEGLEVSREYLDKDLKNIAKVKLGAEVVVRLRARSLGSLPVSDLAIVDLLPGGFEPVLEARIGNNEHVRPDSNEGGEGGGDTYNENEGSEGDYQNTPRTEDQGTDPGDNQPADGEGTALLRTLFPLNMAWAQATPVQAGGLNPLYVTYVDMREDRVLVFGAASAAAQEFKYKIKAVNRGEFTVPPIFGEAMYERTKRSRGAGAKISIE